MEARFRPAVGVCMAAGESPRLDRVARFDARIVRSAFPRAPKSLALQRQRHDVHPDVLHMTLQLSLYVLASLLAAFALPSVAAAAEAAPYPSKTVRIVVP